MITGIDVSVEQAVQGRVPAWSFDAINGDQWAVLIGDNHAQLADIMVGSMLI